MKLYRLGSEEEIVVDGRVVAGRHPECDLPLRDTATSEVHAVLECRYATSTGSWLRDLGSRNGTFLNKRRLHRGEWAALEEGDEVVFACAMETWIVTDLPGPRSSPAVNTNRRATIEVDPRIAIQERRLTLQPALDGESAKLTFEVDGAHYELPHRVHAYVLVPLALARVEDEAAGLLEREAGWRHWSEVADHLGCGQSDINNWVYRTRRALGRIGCQCAQHIVERRQSCGVMRIGVANPDLLGDNVFTREAEANGVGTR